MARTFQKVCGISSVLNPLIVMTQLYSTVTTYRGVYEGLNTGVSLKFNEAGCKLFSDFESLGLVLVIHIVSKWCISRAMEGF